MKRTIVTIVLILAVIGGVVFLFYRWINEQNYRQYNPVDAVPLNATMVLNVEEFEIFVNSLKSNAWWNSLNGNRELHGFARMVNFIDSVSKSDQRIKTFLRGNSIIAAFYSNYSQESEFLVSLKIPKDFSQGDILELVKLQSLGLVNAEDVLVSGSKGILLKNPSSQNSGLTFIVFGNLLLVSNSQELLVESVEMLKDGSGSQPDEQFKSLFLTAASGVAANIFVNTNELSKVLSLKQNSNVLKGVTGWVGLDVQVSSNSILANGLVLNSNQGNDFYEAFTRQTPVPFTLKGYMPAATSFFTWYGLPNISNFMADYSDYIDYLGLAEPYNKNRSGFLSLTGISFDEFLSNNLNGEVAASAVKLDNDSTEWFMFINTKSGSATMQQLEVFSKNFKLNRYEYKPDNHSGFMIVENPIKTYLPTMLGNSFLNVTDSYVTAIDNVLVFGPSVSSIKFIINEYLRNNTLRSSANFNGFQQRISTASNLIVYCNGMVPSPIGEVYLHGEPLGLYMGEKTFKHEFVWQVVGGSQKLFAMLVVESVPLESERISALPKNAKWICKLDMEPTGKPHRLINHLNSQVEFLVQDSNNAIYLIGNNGHILWKRKIDSPIIGDVYQVDIFSNRKLQMAFAAGNKIYVIDRNGDNVEGFPLTLPAVATSPLSIFDYDKNRRYRFMVACADKRIHCYDSSGKPVNGWSNFKTETIVTSRIGFVSYQGKDFLVIFDHNRLYLLNRRGEERVKPQSFFAKARNAEFYLVTSSGKTPYLVTTDTLGIIRKIFFDGNVESMILEPFPSNHTFRMADNKYFILDKNRISIYSGDGKLKNVILSSKGNFDTGSLEVISTDSLLVLASQHGTVVGFSTSGKPVSPFPISGSIPLAGFTSDGKQYVTLSKQNGVICFAVK